MLIMRGTDKPPIKVPLRAVNNVYNLKFGATSYKMSAAWERYLVYCFIFGRQQFKEEIVYFVGGSMNSVLIEEATRIFGSRHPITEVPGLSYEDIPCYADENTGMEVLTSKGAFNISLKHEKQLLDIIKKNPCNAGILEIESELQFIFGSNLKCGIKEGAEQFLNQHGIESYYLPVELSGKTKKRSSFAPHPVAIGVGIITMLFITGITLMNSGKTVLFILGFILFIVLAGIFEYIK